MATPFQHRYAPLEQQATNLIYYRRSARHPALAHSMQRLHVELIVALDGHEAHGGPAHRLRNCFRIDVIVLVCLYKRLHILRRDETNLVYLLLECFAKKVGTTTRFHANQMNLEVRCKTQQL